MKNLASSIRPKTLSDIIGQKHLLSENGILTKMVQKNELYSLIFYGPPGCGKTTLCQSLANDLKIPYFIYNASIDNKSKLEEIIEISKLHNRFIIIVEEIHRLHRDKQDIFLSLLEQHKIYIFAITTENPFFAINPAIRSRCHLLELYPNTSQEIFDGLKLIINKYQLNIEIDDECLMLISKNANGDIRYALNILDLLLNLYQGQKIDKNILSSIVFSPVILASHYGDEYHNLKSAFHKSLRGSDPDASLHYLARLIRINALDDIARRMLAVAYEDVGLANPNLALRVSSGIESAYRLGFPEANNILSCLCIQLACSPKSNTAYKAINNALNDLNEYDNLAIPKHLWDNNYDNAKKLGVNGYLYPHNYPNSYVKQQYMPSKLENIRYFDPSPTNENEMKLMTDRKSVV